MKESPQIDVPMSTTVISRAIIDNGVATEGDGVDGDNGWLHCDGSISGHIWRCRGSSVRIVVVFKTGTWFVSLFFVDG